ncbi:hypothetical protein HHI36_021199 [Cryptolaemus montrouzieri]|uniref:Maturase K n=1 Tax=Cryptolaemus montrouzieri TaxID=559131 RepID=A0ABD2MX22_9CUCU
MGGTASILEAHLSDHSGQKFVFPHKVSPSNSSETILKRLFSPENVSVFLNSLESQNWENIYTDLLDANKMWNFSSIYNSTFNFSFPLTKCKRQIRRSFTSTLEIKRLKRLCLDESQIRWIKIQYDLEIHKVKQSFHGNIISTAQNKSRIVGLLSIV